MRILGVDPGGASGAIALITENGMHAEWYPMPMAGKDIDTYGLACLIAGFEADVAFVEKVHAMPGNGAVAMFSFGRSYGTILGVLGALGLKVELVTPQAWKKVILAGGKKDKDAAIAYCSRAFPKVSLLTTPRCKKPNNNAADALCIAQYGVLTTHVL